MSNWTDAELLAAWQALSPTPATLADGAALLAAQTVATVADTAGAPVMGVLFARGSWVRVQEVVDGAYSTLPVNVVAVCQTLVAQANQNLPVMMSVPAVSTAVQASLALLAATKLPDGKGIIWAAGELASGDPGDPAALMAALVNLMAPRFVPAPTAGDLQTAGA